jgi:hypothetical protein
VEDEQELIEEARRSREETERLRRESEAEEEPWGKPSDEEVSEDDS